MRHDVISTFLFTICVLTLVFYLTYPLFPAMLANPQSTEEEDVEAVSSSTVPVVGVVIGWRQWQYPRRVIIIFSVVVFVVTFMSTTKIRGGNSTECN